jgi:hypothetical protein
MALTHYYMTHINIQIDLMEQALGTIDTEAKKNKNKRLLTHVIYDRRVKEQSYI